MNTNWQALDDDDLDSMGYTTNTANAYMEVDLGEGGREITTVRVIHSTWARPRSNGITLSVLDGARVVLYQHTFSGFDNLSSPMIDVFRTSPSSVQHTTLVGDAALWVGPWLPGQGSWLRPTE
jgi:hypothetical protein